MGCIAWVSSGQRRAKGEDSEAFGTRAERLWSAFVAWVSFLSLPVVRSTLPWNSRGISEPKNRKALESRTRGAGSKFQGSGKQPPNLRTLSVMSAAREGFEVSGLSAKRCHFGVFFASFAGPWHEPDLWPRFCTTGGLPGTCFAHGALEGADPSRTRRTIWAA